MITEEELSLAELEKDVPCGMLCPPPRPCGQPAVARLWFRCACGHQSRVFCCAECRDNIMTGDYACWHCKRTAAVIREC